jgi:putative intracellular protease/amidase
MTESQPQNKKIGILIETHFDEVEFRRFNEYFPANGYQIEYLSYLWGQPELEFVGIDLVERVRVSVDVNHVEPGDYAGIVLIGAYAMDRLRYEEHPRAGVPNQAPAVNFLRRAVATGGLTIGTICHGLWLFCAAPELLKGRRVTSAHNIMYDVMNAGGIYVYDGDMGADTVVDGNLVTARHPMVLDKFLDVFLQQVRASQPALATAGRS